LNSALISALPLSLFEQPAFRVFQQTAKPVGDVVIFYGVFPMVIDRYIFKACNLPVWIPFSATAKMSFYSNNLNRAKPAPTT
jgi:hypothetical protein